MDAARVPEHPDEARERRRDVLNLVFGLGIVGLLAGIVLLVLAVTTAAWWAGEQAPLSVVQATENESRTGTLLALVSLAVVLASWIWTRAPRAG